MMRIILTAGLCIALAGCAGTIPSRPTSTPAATATPEPAGTPVSSTPATVPSPPSTPAPSSAAWPAGVVAYPTGSSVSPLPYLEYLPQGYDGTPLPLIVFLHGVGEAGNGSSDSLQKVLKLGLPRLLADGAWPAEWPFVVLMPQETPAASESCRFGADVDRFLDYAVDRYAIDESRIYLTGISCGAIAVLDTLARSPEGRVAAAVPIASAPYEPPYDGTEVIGGCAIAKIPTWFFHGALDEVVPVSYVEDAVADLRACDPPPTALKLTVYPDGHHDDDTWGRTYDGSAGHDIYGWLLGHRSESHD